MTFNETNKEFELNFGENIILNGGSGGENGTTFFPSVSAEGVISWTNDGGLQNPAPVNIKGKDGADGKDGKDGEDGKDGKDGYTPQKGVDYFDGKDGVNGKDGQNGVDGKTPIKGTDYFTEEDKQELIGEIFAQVIDGSEVSY